MKGLMLKELYLTRKLRIIGAAVWLVIILLCILVRLSAAFGNIGRLNEGIVSNVNSTAFYLMVFGGTVILYSCEFVNSIQADEKSGFRVYEHTLPLSEKQIVGSVYLVNLISFAAATLINWLTLFIACAVFGRSPEPKYLLYIFGIGIAIYTLSHFFSTLTYFFRSSKKTSAVKCVIFMTVYFACTFGVLNWINSYFESRVGVDLYVSEAEKNAALEAAGLTDYVIISDFFKHELLGKLRWLGDNSWWLIPTAVLGIIALSYFLSVKALKRRGARC